MTFKGPTHLSGKFILRGQAIGFSVLIALMLLVEFLRLPHYLFGESREIIWTRIFWRTAIVGVIWIVVHLTTKRLLTRLHELEEFLRICSWCRKVGHKEEWLTMEEYFGSRFSTETSHGICPDCARHQLAAHRESLRCEAVRQTPGQP